MSFLHVIRRTCIACVDLFFYNLDLMVDIIQALLQMLALDFVGRLLTSRHFDTVEYIRRYTLLVDSAGLRDVG